MYACFIFLLHKNSIFSVPSLCDTRTKILLQPTTLQPYPTRDHSTDNAMNPLNSLSLDAADLVNTLGEEVFGSAPTKKTGMFARRKSKNKEPVIDLTAIDVKDIESPF